MQRNKLQKCWYRLSLCQKKLTNVTHLLTILTLHPELTKPHELYTEHISDVHCNDILFRSHTTLLPAIPIIIVFGINGIKLKPFPLTIRMIGRMTIFGSWRYWIFGGSKWHKSTIMSMGNMEWNIMMTRPNHQHTHFTNRTELTPANMSTV